MTPDAQYWQLPAFGHTPEQHAAHTSPKGIPNPEDLIPGMKSTKLAKLAMKFAHKKHLNLKSPSRRVKRKKKE